MYVRRLVVGPNCRLDLNNLNLYCLYASIDSTGTILNGSVTGGSVIEPNVPIVGTPPPTAITPPTWASCGDFNLDGRIDGLDFLAWQRGYHAGTQESVEQGDANGDGVVDGSDFLIWQRNYMNTHQDPNTATNP